MRMTTKGLALLCFASLALLIPAGSASAASWSLAFDQDTSTHLAPGAEVAYFLTAKNIGSTASGSGPEDVTRVEVTLPPGLTATAAEDIFGEGRWSCEGLGTTVVSCRFPYETPAGKAVIPLAVVAVLDPGADPGVLAPATAQIAGGGGEGGANVPTLPDGTTPCGHAGSAVPFQPPCAGAASKTIRIDPDPPFGIEAFDGGVSADAAGAPFTQAAAHPYAASTSFALNTDSDPLYGPSWPVEPLKDAVVDLPPGLIGSPAGLASCTMEQLNPVRRPEGADPYCPPESQIGVATLAFAQGTAKEPPGGFALIPVYNMVAPPNLPARFAFNAAGTPVFLDPVLRSGGDYGVSIDVRNIGEGVATIRSEVTLWGFPADPSHDAERRFPGSGFPGAESTADPEKPFLRNPTSCTAPGVGLPAAIHADSWFHPGARTADGLPDLADPSWASRSFLSHDPPGFPLPESEWGPEQGTTGCEQVPFEPSIAVTPSTHEAASPTGLSVDLSLPQDWREGELASADLKKAVVTLPQGMTVNPSSADGLGACTEAQANLHSNGEANCPASSKIGTVQIQTPLLEEELEGSVYLAAQNDNPFDSLLALYIVARGPGVVIKLPGSVSADPVTGQLTTSFDDNPQLPFEHFHLEFKSGARAPLVNPPTCGTKSAEADFSSWARPDQPVHRSSAFQITSGPHGSACPNSAFDPKLSAGTASPLAGAFSPFALRLSREDGTRELTGVSATLPPGLVGKLAGIPYCPEAVLASIPSAEGSAAAQLASPSCPPASQVGVLSASAGAGPTPFQVNTGRAYLAGPYKGAPLSMAFITPALAGPFDLGNVVVRAALRVDPASARITAVSDPIPTFLHGIPLSLRSIAVSLDKPDFTLNPTSCDPMSIEATASGTGGASAALSSHFQVGNCAALGFKPKLALRLSGPTHRSAHPRLRAVLRMPTGGANIAKAVVTLPKSEILEQSHIRTICTRVQYAADACPPGSVYGYAQAWSPLLDQPLQGPVYLRSSSHELPDLVASLDGQIQVDLAGRIDSVNARIRNTFEAVPDAPVSKFVLTMQGGKKGLLVNTTELCRAKPRASAKFDAQNGKVHDIQPLVKADCGKRGKKKHRR
jgi:hypothetical protein